MSQEPENFEIDLRGQGSDESYGDQPESLIPSVESITDFLMYGLSLPERAIRSSSAAVSGVVRESTDLLVPSAFRSSKSYNIFVEQMLDFMAHDVGGVEREGGNSEPQSEVENYVARKAVGGFVDLAMLPLLHVSPMAVLAIVSDVAYGSQVYLKELSDELKKQGVIDQDSTIDHASDLLDALNKTSSMAADAFDTPPISVEGLAETIRQVTESANQDVTKAIPQSEIQRLWNEMHEIAMAEERDVFEISSAMTMFAMNRIGQVGQGALSTMTIAGNMFDRHILEHYRHGLHDINERGFYASLADSSRPYITAVWENFSTSRDTITEDVLSGRMISRTWKTVSGWLSGDSSASEPAPELDTSDVPQSSAPQSDASRNPTAKE